MDDIIMRSRYPRHSIQSRRKRRYKNTGYPMIDNKLLNNILRQVFITVLILITAGILKSINTPVTNYLTGKVREAIFYDIEPKSIFEGIDYTIGRLVNNKLINKEETGFDEDAVTTSASSYIPSNIVEDAGNSDFTNDNESQKKQVVPAASSVISPTASPSTLPSVSPAPAAKKGAVTGRSSGLDDNGSRKYSFATPAEGYLGSPYGERTDPFTKALKMHKGIDIEANKGASVKAALAGDVIEAGFEQTYGNYIKLMHQDGFTTVYAHCSQLLVKKGQKVKQGDVIAKVGDTGASVGAHLHFEVWQDGKAIDPTNFVKVPVK